MIVPKLDRKSAELKKQIMERVRADAERELRKRLRTMPLKQRSKLKSLLNNIKFLGDVGKAMARTRVSKELFD